MRVGIDATSWTIRRGFGRFARNAVSRLVELDPHTTYVLYVDSESAGKAALPAGAAQRRIHLRRGAARLPTAGSRRALPDLIRLARAVRSDSLDAFLFPSLYTYFPGVRAPTVVGIHDAIGRRFPELTLPTWRARALWRAKESLAIRSARLLFTVSEPARDELARYLGVAPQRVAVVPEAPDPVFYPRTSAEAGRALAPLGIDSSRSFLLYAGGISPHKGIETLVEAYPGLLARRGHAAPQLVIAGDYRSDPFLSAGASVRAQIDRLGLHAYAQMPGFVSDEVLACLYSAARAVALPSRAEGFGLTAVEAAACGAPLVLSDLPAHRAALGDAALYFPPGDAPDLEAALARVLDDDELRRSLGERACEEVSSMTWDVAADRLRELIVQAADGGRP